MNPLVFVEASIKGVLVEVRVNDIPVVKLSPASMRAVIPIPQDLVFGDNRVSVQVKPSGERERQINLRVVEMQDGDEFFTGAGRVLADIEVGGSMVAPSAERAFIWPHGPRAWSWQACQHWRTAEEAGRDAQPFVAKLITAFYGADVNAMIKFAEPLYRDLAIAFPNRTYEDRVAMAREDFGSTGRAFSAGRFEQWQPKLVGEGRLLQLVTSSDTDLLEKHSTEGLVSWPVMIGKAGPDWRVFR